MLKRKSGDGKKSKTKRAKPLSAAEVSGSEDEAAPEEVVVAAAAAAAAPSRKASSLKEGIAMLNADEASRASGRTRSLFQDAKSKPKVTLEGLPGSGDPFIKMVIDQASVLPIPQAGKQQAVEVETPVFPVGFIDLNPVSVVQKNATSDYPKANPADCVATLNVDGEELLSNEEYESSREGMRLLYHMCSNIFCQPSQASVFPASDCKHIEDHRAAALAGDEEAKDKFISGALVDANRTRGPPYLPCQASEPGARGSLKDFLKTGEIKKFKMTTKFFTFPPKDGKGSGAHQPSIDLARQVGGEYADELIKVLEMPENHGRQLKLVPLYDEHMKPVPVEKYRETVEQLKGGAVMAKVSLRVGGKSLGPKNRTAHVAAYVSKVCIVKRGNVYDAPPTGGGIAAFLG